MRSVDAIIADGGSLSESVVTGGLRLIGIKVPPEFIGTMITFQASIGGGFKDLYSDAGDEIMVWVTAADSVIGIDAQRNELETLRWATHMKIRAGTHSSPAPQTGDQAITLLLQDE